MYNAITALKYQNLIKYQDFNIIYDINYNRYYIKTLYKITTVDVDAYFLFTHTSLYDLFFSSHFIKNSTNKLYTVGLRRIKQKQREVNLYTSFRITKIICSDD